MKPSELPKKILAHLTPDELSKLKKYESSSKESLEIMIKAQSDYTKYVRQSKDSISSKARKLADKGFKTEYNAFKAKDNLDKYLNELKKKYTLRK